MKVALIDYIISPAFKEALKNDVVPITIENNDTFVSLKDKIIAASAGEPVSNIVIAQHSRLVMCIGVEMVDFMAEDTQTGLKQFLIDMKAAGVVSVDFLACLMYAQPGVPEMFTRLEAETGVDLRASTDITGNAGLGGNWLMESDMIDIEDIYFTKKIEEFKEIFIGNIHMQQKLIKDVCGNNVYLNVDICGRPINPYFDISGYNVKYPSGSVVAWPTGVDGGNTSAVSSSLASGVVAIYSGQYAFAALKTDGSVVAWGNSAFGGAAPTSVTNANSNVVAIYSAAIAFAALKKDGSVVAWGHPGNGGSAPSSVTNANSNVVAIYSTPCAFAALKKDGSVVTWGNSTMGGVAPSSVTDPNSNVVAIYSTQDMGSFYGAFAALKKDGSVVAWGYSGNGGDASTVASSLTSGVVSIYSTQLAFAALKTDGSVVAWGNSSYGGSAPTSVTNANSNVVAIYSNQAAFAALKKDGSVVAWGNSNYGNSPPTSVTNANSNVVAIYSTKYTFAALKKDGSVVAWGISSYGGSAPTSVTNPNSNVVAIYSASSAFAALKSDGSVVTWGVSADGGDSSAVANKLTSGVLTIFSAINSYGEYSGFAALKTDGSVVVWGRSAFGSSPPTSVTNANAGVIAIASTFGDIAGAAFAAIIPTTPVNLLDYYYTTGASKLIKIAPATAVAVDATSVSLKVYKNTYNPLPGLLSVSASGGSGIYTYSWTGVTSSTNSVKIPYKADISGETISVQVSDSFTTATKTFNITYLLPETITNFATSIPDGEIRITTDQRLVANVATGVGSIVGQIVNMTTYTPPSGQNIATIAVKITEQLTNSYKTIMFDVNKYTSAGVAVTSTLDVPSTYGTVMFDVSSNIPFLISWKNGTTIYTLASYTPSRSPTSSTSHYATLTLNSTSGGRSYFTYVGPNSETTITMNPPNASGVPCFVAGTRILTPAGEKPVETLKTGDVILTADGRKVSATIYTTKIDKTTNETAPYLIPASAFSAHFPPQDICLSPKHAIMSGKNTWEIPQFAEGRFPAIQKTRVGESVTYYHIELPNFFTDNIIANGSVCESLGAKAQQLLPKGQSMYSFNKKLGGFTRYNPESKKTIKK